MPRVLVVEDSPVQAQIISGLLEAAGLDTESTGDGAEALAAIDRHAPDLVLTDLIMPRVSGLELVETLSRTRPAIPVILMTAYGSGEIAMQALRKGAASYVSKKRLAEDLVDTIHDTLAVAQARREQARVIDCLADTEFHFRLENDPSLIYPLLAYLKDAVAERVRVVGESLLTQIGIAVHEALVNAMHHGNLEVASDLRQEDLQAYLDMVERRRADPAYATRYVDVRARISRSELRCTVADQGRGFDPASVPDPTDPANLEKPSGRGLYLILTFMDEVAHNRSGNSITMVKRFEDPEPGETVSEPGIGTERHRP